MNYTVLWRKSAEGQLAQLWPNAADRNAVASAADDLFFPGACLEGQFVQSANRSSKSPASTWVPGLTSTSATWPACSA
jgi:hypothetical protein